MAGEIYVATKMTHAELITFLRSLPARLSGRVADPSGIGREFRMRLAFGFFSECIVDWDTKSQGGQGRDGISWPKLSRAYLAYQKGRPEGHSGTGGRYKQDKAGKVAPLHRVMRDEHLTPAQKRAWLKEYKGALAQLVTRHPIERARTLAVNAAWAATRADRAPTLLKQFGGRQTTILVDEGNLRRSIQPGELVATANGSDYQPKSADQAVEEKPGEIAVGSNLKTARWHHGGRGKNPKRAFWPDNGLPPPWADTILNVCASGILRIADLVRAGGAL
jgi:hypothetical protein